MDTAALYRQAAEGFGTLVHRIGDDGWEAITPCTDWTVHDLVNHLVYEDLWAVDLFAGRTIAEVGDRYEGDILGDDPVTAWEQAVAGALEAVADPDVMDRTVHLSFGDFPGREYAMQLITDHTIHGWDLAAAIGADTALDDDLIQAIDDWFDEQHQEAYRQGGALEPPLYTPPGSDARERLLAAFGRPPNWTPAIGVVQRFNQRLFDGDVEGAADLCTDDIVFENTWPAPDGTRLEGRAAMRESLADMIGQTRNPRATLEEITGLGDHVVERHVYAWDEPDGSPGHVRGMDLFRVADGHIAELRAYVKG